MKVHAFPASNKIAQKHFRDTIHSKVPLKLIEPFLNDNLSSASLRLPSYSVWGLTDSHKSKFKEIAKNDIGIFYQDGRFFKSGNILATFQSAELGKKLWFDDNKLYTYIIVFEELFDISINIEDFNLINNIYGDVAEYKRPLLGYFASNEEASGELISQYNLLNLSTRNYWWVNQKQTYKQEIHGGYMWSPKLNKDGSRSQFYDYMTEVKPGDFIFSYYNGKLQQLGVAISNAVDVNKPTELEDKAEWNTSGWLVNVEYTELDEPRIIKTYIERIKPSLPEKYSPLKFDGNANQAYLFKINKSLSDILIDIVGEDFQTAVEFLEDIQESVNQDDIDFNLDENTKTSSKQITQTRKGQGVFKRNVSRIESKCRVTGISNIKHLIASHIKPWKYSDNKERLDGYNGLLLSPHVDHLFDRGFISFKDSGELLISNYLDDEIKKKWQLEVYLIHPFSQKQCKYLKYHRDNIFK